MQRISLSDHLEETSPASPPHQYQYGVRPKKSLINSGSFIGGEDEKRDSILTDGTQSLTSLTVDDDESVPESITPTNNNNPRSMPLSPERTRGDNTAPIGKLDKGPNSKRLGTLERRQATVRPAQQGIQQGLASSVRGGSAAVRRPATSSQLPPRQRSKDKKKTSAEFFGASSSSSKSAPFSTSPKTSSSNRTEALSTSSSPFMGSTREPTPSNIDNVQAASSSSNMGSSNNPQRRYRSARPQHIGLDDFETPGYSPQLVEQTTLGSGTTSMSSVNDLHGLDTVRMSIMGLPFPRLGSSVSGAASSHRRNSRGLDNIDEDRLERQYSWGFFDFFGGGSSRDNDDERRSSLFAEGSTVLSHFLADRIYTFGRNVDFIQRQTESFFSNLFR